MSDQVYLVNHRAAKVVLSRANPEDANNPLTLELMPGISGPYDASEIAAFRQNAVCERIMFKSGTVVIGQPDSTPLAEQLAEIADCQSIDQLKRWINTRGHNADVLEAMRARHNELSPIDSEDARRAKYEAGYA